MQEISPALNAFVVWIAMGGTVAFAVTAVLAVAPKGIDLFGACIMGIITAVGGGTIRDVILDVPVFWASDLSYIWVALGASVIAYYAQQMMASKHVYGLMLYLDGIAVAMFAIQAASKVVAQEFGVPLAPILLGIVTAIGGGLIRDVLSGNETLLMKKELYAVPVTLGTVIYVVALPYFPESEVALGTVCALIIFAIRAAAIRWNLSVPDWAIIKLGGN
ncbi:trimeric intracellular cation channel family protein [Tropicimonas sp. IMCC34043]|uniref:trimeric intracellular cation channel family protein n=1 Tax=Tropicimonas sp. IMCC34043 TaxID=2248760 RepID=UPI000E23DB7E|nr:TRIC cation channel family protein [Tropicimonas sp. IMCC34043]